MRWKNVKVESIRATTPYSLVGGPFGSNLTTRDYVDDGVPVIRGTNLPAEREFEDDGFVFVSEEKADALKSNIAYPGDIVFTQRGTLGQVGIIPSGARFQRYVVSQSQMKLTVNHEVADPRFVYYFFRHPETVEQIKRRSITSGVPHINLGILKDFYIPLPPSRVQAEIVKVLAGYDAHIENNRRRIALLEESARLLYREWFIRLRFPGYEHNTVVGGVPTGWSSSTFGDLCVDVRDAVSPDAFEPDTPYIGLEHLPRRSITLGEWGKAEQVTSSKHRFAEGDILFGKIRPYFHKVGVAFVDGVASSDAIVIRPRHADFHSLVLLTASSDEFVADTAQAMKEGSKMPRADWKQMQAYPVALPPPGLLRTFDGVVQPIIAQLKTLTFANHKLRTARDLLLPRLMSGELTA
jgi:type I restriction enzyme S subunit